MKNMEYPHEVARSDEMRANDETQIIEHIAQQVGALRIRVGGSSHCNPSGRYNAL